MENNTTPTVQELIKEIKTGLKQKSASRKDEEAVMKAMLNDKSFIIKDYSTNETH